MRKWCHEIFWRYQCKVQRGVLNWSTAIGRGLSSGVTRALVGNNCHGKGKRKRDQVRVELEGESGEGWPKKGERESLRW